MIGGGSQNETRSPARERVRVLVVDDSALMRKLIRDILSRDSRFEVIATARDGLEAVEKTRELSPDVVTLDVEMPGMDGLAALERIMREKPTPVVMLSTLTQEGAQVTLRALDIGAVDFVPKPSGSISLDLDKVASQLIVKVAQASQARLGVLGGKGKAGHVVSVEQGGVEFTPQRLLHQDPVSRSPKAESAADRLVVIGASTGGPRAIQTILAEISPDLPAAMIVVQHMPPGFTRAFAERLNAISRLCVAEAVGGEKLVKGGVWVAPGDCHVRVVTGGVLRRTKEPPVRGLRPAVDLTMESAAEVYGPNCVGVVLTGMGTDGTYGLSCIKRRGGKTLAEDESTSVIYGMPRSAKESGAAQQSVPLYRMAHEIEETVRKIETGRENDEG